MTEFDPGPPAAIAEHLANVPSYAEHRELFWYDWGPVFYRGRLDGSARLLGIASDPGPTERIACRSLVGDAGQRVQGFLSKLGLTRSYVMVNAYAYALLPSRAPEARPLLSEPEHLAWRNGLYDALAGPGCRRSSPSGQRRARRWRCGTPSPRWRPSSCPTPAATTTHGSCASGAPGSSSCAAS